MPTYRPEDVTALAEAAWQILDDMGVKGLCCSGAAKVMLRVAYEPFVEDVDSTENFMPLDEAERILATL